MSKFQVTVLGPIPKDHITTHRQEVIEKYGCAMHTTIGLSKLLGDAGTVIPVAHVRKMDKAPIEEILAAHPNVQAQHITTELDQGDVIHLEFLDANNRVEKQTGFMNPILPADLTELMDSDVFVCVPITDYEVPLETLKYIRKNSKGLIIFDAHGPTNTVTITGDRLLRFWLDRDQWLPYIDVLKMNLEESHCCWFEKPSAPDSATHFEDPDTSHLPALAEHVLKHGVKSLIVTLDANGGMLFHLQDGKLVQEFIPAVSVDHVVDTTGCGDSFAGGLGFGLLENATDYVKAVKYANALGAQRTQGRTFEVFKSLEETNQMIIDQYGSL